jgi:hypothetical protein
METAKEEVKVWERVSAEAGGAQRAYNNKELVPAVWAESQ